MLRSDLCDYSDEYIVVKGFVTVSVNAGVNNIRDKKSGPLAFKNNAPFVSCISKINGVLTHFNPMFHLWKNQVVGFY